MLRLLSVIAIVATTMFLKSTFTTQSPPLTLNGVLPIAPSSGWSS